MDIDDTTDDRGRNLMHQTNDGFCIGENAKVTQHDPDFENSDEGDDEEHLEAYHSTILAVNVANNNACICQSENLIKRHKRSQPRSSFAPFDINCPKQQRIFNIFDQVDLQTLKRRQEFYTYPCGININQIF